MSETAAFLALIESASSRGVEARRRFLGEHGEHEMGWSYANIGEVDSRLNRQIGRKGFFRLFLYVPREGGGSVTHWMRITGLKTYSRPTVFNDPADGRRYLVHSRMVISSIETLDPALRLESFRSIDNRKPDPRHLELGFLFVVDPEV
ncbi:MAG: hypothetical protein JSV26_08255 [bacterium]|nr:MAG: hypothetical protein JSV26_08255 [bacterium]